MIAHLIGDPIGSDRVCPNRPRIARIKSCRINPSKCVGRLAFPISDARHLRVPAPSPDPWSEGMR